MEQVVSIKSKDNLEPLALIIKNHLLENFGIIGGVEYRNRDGVYKVIIDKSIFYKVSGAIAECIIRSYALFFVRKLIDRTYEELSVEEIYRIVNLMHEKICYSDRFNIAEHIKENLQLFCEEFREVSFDGIMTFGFSDYEQELLEILDECIDELLIEEELEEFLGLMQSYTEAEETRLDVLNIIARPDTGYSYYDELGNDITDECKTEFYNEIPDKAASDDDMLISILIIMLPKKIILHKKENITNKNLINTIKEIFGKRFSICTGKCGFCKM